MGGCGERHLGRRPRPGGRTRPRDRCRGGRPHPVAAGDHTPRGRCHHPRHCAASGPPSTVNRSFDELVAEAEKVPIQGWDFSWLEGRATEERPSWRYFDRVAERVPTVSSWLDLQTG